MARGGCACMPRGGVALSRPYGDVYVRTCVLWTYMWGVLSVSSCGGSLAVPRSEEWGLIGFAHSAAVDAAQPTVEASGDEPIGKSKPELGALAGNRPQDVEQPAHDRHQGGL